MTQIPGADRLVSLLGFPWELVEYQRFVEAQARSTRTVNDLFSDERPRFEPRPEDLLTAPDDVVLSRHGSGVSLSSRQAGARVECAEISESEARRLLRLMDGTHTAAEIGWQEPSLRRLLRATFGLVVFAPAAVRALEQELPGCEISRFPGSPYAIARPYWENMVAVRRAIKDDLGGVLGDPRRGLEFLRELHVLATMGPSLGSFYKPSSPVSDGGVMPGRLWDTETRTVATASGTLLLSGPRVKASAIAGELYHHLVHAQLGDPAASDPERAFGDEDGLAWGQILIARAATDDAFASWYCLPRPRKPEHAQRLFEELGQALDAAETGDAGGAIRQAARFHWRFVHLHPFRCANQCLAMNLVNHVLKRVLPSGMPHLILDQFALRLRPEPYQLLFARAASHYAIATSEPSLRYAELRAKRQLAFCFMQRVGQAESHAAAEPLIHEYPDEARAALLEPG